MGPAQPLTSAKLLALLDRFYDLEADEPTWLRGIAEAIRPLVDCGAGVNAWTLELAPWGRPKVTHTSLGHDFTSLWSQFRRAVPMNVLTGVLLRTPISNAAKCRDPHMRQHARAGHQAMGLHSLSGINGFGLDHKVISIGVPAPDPGIEFWPRRDRLAWERIAGHLGAALRLRSRGAAAEPPSLVMDAAGRVLHAATYPATLRPLHDAMASVARARQSRLPPEAVLAAWRALHGGAWSIVESVERDGRRLLLARPNLPLRAAPPAPTGPTAGTTGPRPTGELSRQERRALIALAQGLANKAIADTLGTSPSTVSTLLARAAHKLGYTDRVRLALAGRALATEAPVDRDAPGPRRS
ncbi:MAG: hypothetical protein IPI49_05115 [Myxococcales bacterium]|nr:hypothetical protein [Myxococcales bacterium]